MKFFQVKLITYSFRQFFSSTIDRKVSPVLDDHRHEQGTGRGASEEPLLRKICRENRPASKVSGPLQVLSNFQLSDRLWLLNRLILLALACFNESDWEVRLQVSKDSSVKLLQDWLQGLILGWWAQVIVQNVCLFFPLLADLTLASNFAHRWQDQDCFFYILRIFQSTIPLCRVQISVPITLYPKRE